MPKSDVSQDELGDASMARRCGLCRVCGKPMNGRRWRVMDLPPRWWEFDPTSTVSNFIIESCSEACGQVLIRWMDERWKREAGR